MPWKDNLKQKWNILACHSRGIYPSWWGRQCKGSTRLGAETGGWVVTLHLHSWFRRWIGSRSRLWSLKSWLSDSLLDMLHSLSKQRHLLGTKLFKIYGGDFTFKPHYALVVKYYKFPHCISFFTIAITSCKIDTTTPIWQVKQPPLRRVG